MVQGEYMETVLSTKIKNFFPGLALLMAGFLAGLLIPNFIYCFSWKQQAFSAIYLLTAYGKTGAEGTDYLLKIIWMRGSFFFLSLLCGFTVFGVPIAVGAMLFTGLELGMVFSMSIWAYRRSSCSSASFSTVSDLSAIMECGLSDDLQGVYGNLA